MGRVKLKYGTYEQYQAATKDNDTLYFITDLHQVYKGNNSVTNAIDIVATNATGGGKKLQIIDNTDTDAQGAAKTYDIYDKDFIDVVVSSFNVHRTISAGVYADGPATDRTYGHVILSDAIDDKQSNAATGVTAATPKAVFDALAEAKAYVDTALGDLTGAQVFKGTIGKSAAHPDYTSLPKSDEEYKIGWTYRVVGSGGYTFGTGASQKVCEEGDMIVAIMDSPESGPSVINSAHWTVVQANIDGAVTASNTLASDGIVLGNGNKTVKAMTPNVSDNGKYLKQVNGLPTWSDVNLSNLGVGFGEVINNTVAVYYYDEGTPIICVEIANYQENLGSVVSLNLDYTDISFDPASGLGIDWVRPGSYLEVDIFGGASGTPHPIFYKLSAIGQYVIHRGDTITAMLAKRTISGTETLVWEVISVERPVQTSINAASGSRKDNPVSEKAVGAELDKKQNKLVNASGNPMTFGTNASGETVLGINFTNGISSSNDTQAVNGQQVFNYIEGDNGVLTWIALPPVSGS